MKNSCFNKISQKRNSEGMFKLLIISLISTAVMFGDVFDAYCERLIVSSPIKAGQFIDRIDIEEVEIAEGCGITEIPDYAFLGCSGLKRVILPEGLKKIGFQSFSECSGLEKINFPSTLEDIGSNSFAYCEKLDGLEFKEGLKHIGHNAFSFCTSLNEAILPDSLEEIESYAFSDCSSLKKVRLPDNDNLLGELMMNCCMELEEIIAPSIIAPKFDCESFIFDPEDTRAYAKCVLKIPENGKVSYDVSKSWQIFNQIVTYRK